MNKKIVVIYHRADFDGLFCREIARKFLGDQAEYIGWDYGDEVPLLGAGVDRVYMLDCCVHLYMSHPGLIWIDHHKSQMEKFGSRPGFQMDKVAACRLAWAWFAELAKWTLDLTSPYPPELLPTLAQFVNRQVEEPLAVRLAGEYDVWDKRDPRARTFQFGLRSMVLKDLTWELLLGDSSAEFVQDFLASGKPLEQYQAEQDESVIKEMGFTVRFEGLTFLACNAARYNSLLFTAGLKPEHEALLGFKFTGKEWSVSLYHAPGREEHDLSVIASRYGGGGHRGACGFRLERLPFLAGEGDAGNSKIQ